MRTFSNTFVWLAVPVVLTVGCAEHHQDSSVSYSPALSQSYSRTSDRSEVRVYPETPTGAEVTPTPAGATQQDWVLAEEIRGLLTQNQKLGTAPMAALVNNGV